MSLVKEIKEIYPDIQFIMISQVNSKDMIAKAYKNGIEYYVTKPINAIEIETIINKVNTNIEREKKLDNIRQLIGGANIKSNRKEDYEICLKKVLYRLGIIGEAGSTDLIIIVDNIIKNGLKNKNFSLKQICKKYTDNPKTMEQRMRRAANVAIENIASIGLEDFMNEIFMDYSNSLFNFEQIRIEMNYLKGVTSKRGKIDLKKFLYGLAYHCEKINTEYSEN
ncbi:response regulator [Senegalia massiliensis]|uniref:Stage 0 sporulation protein A homolog n=1 Tax=Senegalia massiliensis TaxID=1720316 RepID=A0A845QY41_9CLOT|nr:response regulator [Senegalia massiliensis]